MTRPDRYSPEKRLEYNENYYVHNQDDIRPKHQTYQRGYRADPVNRTKILQLQRRYRTNMRKRFLDVYGHRCHCKCGCTESTDGFLTVGHINDDGNEDRKNGGYYAMMLRAIKKPAPTKYTTLCWNCNCGARINGGVCPRVKSSLDGKLRVSNPFYASSFVEGTD